MGCCCANNNEKQVFRSSYDEAWKVFLASDLSKYERFQESRQKVFNFLFLSIIIPYQSHVRVKIDELIDKLSGGLAQGLNFARKERIVLNEELKENYMDNQKLLKQLTKIKSEIVEKERSGINNTNNTNAKISAHEQAMQKENEIKANENLIKSFHSKRSGRMDEEKRDSKAIIEAKSFELRGSNLSYTIPRSISQIGRSYEAKSFGELKEIDFKAIQMEMMGKIPSQFLKKKVQQLEQQMEKKKEQEANHQLEVSLLNYEIKDLKEKLQGSKSELQVMRSEKEELSLINKTLNERLLDITASKEDGKSASLVDESNNVLSSLDFSPAQKGKRCTIITKVVEEKIDLSTLSSLVKSESSKAMRSFVVVESLQIPSSQGEIKERNYAILFNIFPNSKILPNHQQFQLAVGIRTIISQMFSSNLTRSELLFSFDTLTPTHYNKYIDDKENLLVLIKLQNGIIIGGFAGSFIENNELSDSFIFSISPQRQPMMLTTNKKIKRIDYDNSYLIFGSGQIKIKARTLQFSCNLGSFQSIYSLKNRSVPVDKFLGTSQRSLTMQGYEIHQLFFAPPQA